MPASIRLSLYRAALHETADSLAVVSAAARIVVQDATAGMWAALRLLSGDGAGEPTLFSQIAGEHFSSGARLRVVLARLDAAGVLAKTLHAGDEPIATALPLTPRDRIAPFEPHAAYTLSRFACCRRVNSEWSLESPLAAARVVLHGGRALALLDALTGDDETAIGFRRLLAEAGMLTCLRPDGTTDEDSAPALQAWSFHDSLFQLGRRGEQAVGAAAPPIVKPPMSPRIARLARPNMDTLMSADVPFTQALEARRSIRAQGETPMTVQQLGEYLYRTARVIELVDGDYAASHRPYPSAGALYPLEVYPLIIRCTGIADGLYHYDPHNHTLEALDAPPDSLPPLIESAVRVTGNQVTNPQVLLIITARYQRTAWKYGTFALSLIHKDAGVLIAHLYLVATAMRLAPCALGVGHTSLFAAASGLDPLDEFAIAGFWIGSLPE